jgi:hypothetical protein
MNLLNSSCDKTPHHYLCLSLLQHLIHAFHIAAKYSDVCK